jgi:pimeloyl-ACP methyl ester carboxylesterase
MEPPFAAYRGSDSYVFVCYSHTDAASVYPEIAHLRSLGLNIWYDEGISPGTEWSEELARALEGADKVLFYISESSVNSRHCRDEISFSHNHDKQVVAIYLSKTELPVGLELSLSSTQAIQKFALSADQYLGKLSATLPALSNNEEGPPGLVPSAQRGSHFLRFKYRYAILMALLFMAGSLAMFNREYLQVKTALYLPLIFSDPIKQNIGFAVSKNNRRIAYATTGEGAPIVYVLGWATHLEGGWDSPVYDNQGVLAMSSEDHLFVRYDGRGFGLSDRQVQDFSLEARVSDLEAVVYSLGLEKFAIYAVSAGGPAGIAYASKNPEKLTSLVLASTQASANHLSAEYKENFELMNPLIEASWENPSVTRLFIDYLFPDYENEYDALTVKIFGEFLRISGQGHAITGFFDQFLTTDVENQASKIEVPTYVVHARGDATIPLEAGRTLASLIPGAKFEIVEGGHNEGIGSVPRVRRKILDFIESHQGDVELK